MKKFTLLLVVMFYFAASVLADVVIIRQDFGDGGKYIKVVPKKLSNDQIAGFWLQQGAIRFGMVVPAITFVDAEKKATLFCNSSNHFFYVRIKDDVWYLGSDVDGSLKLWLLPQEEDRGIISWNKRGRLCLSTDHYVCETTGKKILVMDPEYCAGRVYGYQSADYP